MSEYQQIYQHQLWRGWLWMALIRLCDPIRSPGSHLRNLNPALVHCFSTTTQLELSLRLPQHRNDHPCSYSSSECLRLRRAVNGPYPVGDQR